MLITPNHNQIGNHFKYLLADANSQWNNPGVPIHGPIRGTSTRPTIRMDGKQMKHLRYYRKPNQPF